MCIIFCIYSLFFFFKIRLKPCTIHCHLLFLAKSFYGLQSIWWIQSLIITYRGWCIIAWQQCCLPQPSRLDFQITSTFLLYDYKYFCCGENYSEIIESQSTVPFRVCSRALSCCNYLDCRHQGPGRNNVFLRKSLINSSSFFLVLGKGPL